MPPTVASLTGYVERDLGADLDRFLPHAETAVVTGAKPVEPFLARLAPADAASLAAFDRRVRSGTMPDICDIADWSYGFDFAGNGCGILDSGYETELSDDDVYSIGADGGGNYYVVLTNGQVAVWFHEEEVVEEGTRFANLDVFVWHMVRYRAVRDGVLSRGEVAADFRALGQDGALADEAGLLSALS
ncbi:hypothetical protein Ade02nite_24170 [Paractinoplanes deccanensis]|uniref:SMI1/KNR4 family protein n=1 Tax=Paractinoplanes deccanensis TaxID=113561 RepID=A0ABQ3Y196_9ACTN|nr:hypothetical protein [Actinoplanes deccanensis]GID73776.1 hypothetical protein Ade02nite_24170 [Actinoplanes deccanensis]